MYLSRRKRLTQPTTYNIHTQPRPRPRSTSTQIHTHTFTAYHTHFQCSIVFVRVGIWGRDDYKCIPAWLWLSQSDSRVVSVEYWKWAQLIDICKLWLYFGIDFHDTYKNLLWMKTRLMTGRKWNKKKRGQRMKY